MSGCTTVWVQAPPPVPSALAGVPQVTLQLWLSGAQNAMNVLMTGAQVVNVQYAEGSGHRQVTYTRAKMSDLQMWITQLTYALGTRARRPIRFGF
ncbi:gpW family head-tail joining protein [Acidocella sp.]|uniref:gpW family head-tail joining protein n=1 Tax=Acidocella sp. TaxID=50710 RepID=UPI0026026505|nr:gpW family head-tail joining protein [Acidocella sp.]MDD2794373.1 gpW family head-tail joining protein [Acidocella sp.]